MISSGFSNFSDSTEALIGVEIKLTFDFSEKTVLKKNTIEGKNEGITNDAITSRIILTSKELKINQTIKEEIKDEIIKDNGTIICLRLTSILTLLMKNTNEKCIQ